MNEMLTYLSVFIRFIASVIIAFMVMPKVWEETKVGDGLGRLRRLIFLGITIFLGSNIFVMGTNFGRVIDLLPEDPTIGFLALTNSVQVLILSIILHLIYSYDYGREEPKT